MKDPVSISAATGGIAAASLGTVFGLPVDCLVFGLMGGIVAVLAVPQRSPMPDNGWKLYLALVGSIFVSVMVAAAFGPMTAEGIPLNLTPTTAVRGYSFLWGSGAQAGLLMTAIEALRRRIEQLGGGPP